VTVPQLAAINAAGRVCVLDTETTGLGAGHRVIEVGVVEIVDRRATGREFHAYINPERSIDREAEHIHGITARFLADKPRFRDIAAALILFLGQEGKLVAHQASFDVDMLNAEFARMGVEYRIGPQFQIIDTKKVSHQRYPGQRASVDALAQRLQVSRAEREQSGLHGALIDARILSRIFLALTAGQAQFGYSDGRRPVPQSGIRIDRTRIGALRVIHPTADEEQAHTHLCDVIERISGGQCGFRGQWRPAASIDLPVPNSTSVARREEGPPHNTLSSPSKPVPKTVAPVASGGSLEFAPSV